MSLAVFQRDYNNFVKRFNKGKFLKGSNSSSSSDWQNPKKPSDHANLDPKILEKVQCYECKGWGALSK